MGDLKCFYSNDHDGYWPVGAASIVFAKNEIDARILLDAALEKKGLDPANYTLVEVDQSQPAATILLDGNY